MSRLKVDIECDNAAFRNGDNRFETLEVARILRELADKVEQGRTGHVVHDFNGNKVGNWDLEIDEE